jgi:hypothetical protein
MLSSSGEQQFNPKISNGGIHIFRFRIDGNPNTHRSQA